MSPYREAPPYFKDTLYKDAINQLQTGHWQTGIDLLSQVEARYPAYRTQLQEIQTEMKVRSRIDEYEVEENRHDRLEKTKKFGLITLAALVVGALLFYFIGTYAGILQTQVERAQAELRSQEEYMQLLATYRNAQNLFRAGRAISASAMFEQVSSQVAANDYPREEETFVNLAQELVDSRQVAELETMYNRAMEFLSREQRNEALILFREIESQNPRYRDVDLQIDLLEAYFELENIYTRAEAAAQAEEWEVAIEQYEFLREEDPAFRTAALEDKLFQAYLSYAQFMLDQEESMEQLELAENYFAKALSMRPQDTSTVELRRQARRAVEDALIEKYLQQAEQALLNQGDSLTALNEANQFYFKASQVRPNDPMVALNYEMARRYLNAIEDFNRGLWDLVIEQLEFVYVEDPNFAEGTSTQTLYDAYLARGDKFIKAGDYEAALEDFQRAMEIANNKENALLMVIQSQAEFARALGLLGRYAESIAMYQDAVFKGNLAERARRTNQDVYYNLVNAQVASDNGNLKASYNYYRAALINLNELLGSTTHIVLEGEYLTSLARQYNTTVDAILEANNITSRRIEKDQQLIIPTLDQ